MRAGIDSFRFHTDVSWLRSAGIRGVVIGRHIFLADSVDTMKAWVFRHELQHAYQILRDGLFLFYLKYFYFSLSFLCFIISSQNTQIYEQLANSYTKHFMLEQRISIANLFHRLREFGMKKIRKLHLCFRNYYFRVLDILGSVGGT